MKKSFIILTPSTVLLSLSHFQVFLCLTVFVFNLPAKKGRLLKMLQMIANALPPSRGLTLMKCRRVERVPAAVLA